MNLPVPEHMKPFDDSVTVRSLLACSGIGALAATTGTTEVAVNRPFEAWTEGRSGWTRHEMPGASLDLLTKLANALSIYNRAMPPLSGSAPLRPVQLPDGERGQIVIAPACEPGTVSMTIRIPAGARFSVDELTRGGFLNDYADLLTDQDTCSADTGREAGLPRAGACDTFDDVVSLLSMPCDVQLAAFEREMLHAKQDRDIQRFLQLAIANRLNVVLVGGTGSGKTTLMKALADLVPAHARVATIEDTHELPLPFQPNHVHMFYSETLPAREIVKATLRMKFDRVYLAELRGDETWDYLTLLNTGHQGGMTTVHANDCISALSRIATLVKQSPVGQTLDYDFVLRQVKTTIDVVLFMERKRLVQVYYDPLGKRKLQRGRI